MSVLITRPSPEGEQLVSMLSKQGITAYHQPLIEFRAGLDLEKLPEFLTQLTEGDLLLALSPRALQYAELHLKQRRVEWPTHLHYFAIGQTTAAILSNACQKPVEFPKEKEISEHLLQLPALQQIAGKKALLLRGNGGRTLLREQLEQRGCSVNTCECYQRHAIFYAGAELSRHWIAQGIKTVVVTSGEMLQHLYDLVPEYHRDWLLNSQLIVVSERIATLAQRLGWQHIRVAENAHNTALLRTLIT